VVWNQLARSHGQVPVVLLAEEIGWSRRHFGARFRAQVGLPTKPVARVLRFREAARRLQAATAGSIADVAAAGGYADHSHLVREFRRLAGCTPSALAAEEATFAPAGDGQPAPAPEPASA
jgi:transcriptional regulator GlxA family with amidase domain